MTTKSYKKLLKQIQNKPAKKKRFLKHSKPKDRDTSEKKCRFCGRYGAHISKYGLDLCRQCFRENAEDLGFEKKGQEV